MSATYRDHAELRAAALEDVSDHPYSQEGNIMTTYITKSDTSDVTMLDHDDAPDDDTTQSAGIMCQGCTLSSDLDTGEHVDCKYWDGPTAAGHLRYHVSQGHKVPDSVIATLEAMPGPEIHVPVEPPALETVSDDHPGSDEPAGELFRLGQPLQ